jgi:hypothetical protein
MIRDKFGSKIIAWIENGNTGWKLRLKIVTDETEDEDIIGVFK